MIRLEGENPGDYSAPKAVAPANRPTENGASSQAADVPRPAGSENVVMTNQPEDKFRPPWWLRNGHMQTLAGAFLRAEPHHSEPRPAVTSAQIEFVLPDGDRLVAQDDRPFSWQTGAPVAILLHGLGGSNGSPYMRRIARQLNEKGIRSIRLDWRCCGAGLALARYPYHSGRSDDLDAAMAAIRNLCPGSEIMLVGFSLGGNVALKWLGEAATAANVSRAVAVCPPVCLASSVKRLGKGLGRWYNHYFTRVCIQHVRRRQLVRPDAIVPDNWFKRLPRTLQEFDETFTAPVCGFASAADYYQRCSAQPKLASISVPTLIVAAQDDPLIPFRSLVEAPLSTSTELRSSKHGGHLGFLGRGGPGWLDRQVMRWLLPAG